MYSAIPTQGEPKLWKHLRFTDVYVEFLKAVERSEGSVTMKVNWWTRTKSGTWNMLSAEQRLVIMVKELSDWRPRL